MLSKSLKGNFSQKDILFKEIMFCLAKNLTLIRFLCFK